MMIKVYVGIEVCEFEIYMRHPRTLRNRRRMFDDHNLQHARVHLVQVSKGKNRLEFQREYQKQLEAQQVWVDLLQLRKR